MDSVCKRGNPITGISRLFSFHRLYFLFSLSRVKSPSRLCFLLSSVLSHHPYFSYSSLQYPSILPHHLPYKPSPSPPNTQHPSLPHSPSTPTGMAIKVEGNSLDLKISMSLSLCSCRVASPRAAPRYEWPCLLASSGGPHTHTHGTHHRMHTLSKGHSEAVITSVLQLLLLPLSSFKPISAVVFSRGPSSKTWQQ